MKFALIIEDGWCPPVIEKILVGNKQQAVTKMLALYPNTVVDDNESNDSCLYFSGNDGKYKITLLSLAGDDIECI